MGRQFSSVVQSNGFEIWMHTKCCVFVCCCVCVTFEEFFFSSWIWFFFTIFLLFIWFLGLPINAICIIFGWNWKDFSFSSMLVCFFDSVSPNFISSLYSSTVCSFIHKTIFYVFTFFTSFFLVGLDFLSFHSFFFFCLFSSEQHTSLTLGLVWNTKHDSDAQSLAHMRQN